MPAPARCGGGGASGRTPSGGGGGWGWVGEEGGVRAAGRPVRLAVEGCTGWRFVVEEIIAAGFEAAVAEPADTQAQRGPKRRAKTDRSDARLLRELLAAGTLPSSWVPPHQ